jgi:micrococcal nuclease
MHVKSVFLTLSIVLSAVLLSGCVSQEISGNVVGDGETKVVTKIVDGDTVIIEGGDSVRLLGMDTDERGYPCYSEASKRLEGLILGKEVYLEHEGEDKDQYGRLLRYIFLDDENINLIMVKEGLAVARFDADNTRYKDDFVSAEKYAMENGIGCKWRGSSQTASLPEGTNGSEEICSAKDYVGQVTTLSGKVTDTTKSKTNTVFLNFGGLYPNHCFTAVIFSSDLGKFPENPQTYYKGKNVMVSGKIQLYEGKPEIVLEEASQIEIIQ